MNRTALIIISVLCFITSVSFVYAFVQQGLAKERQAIANNYAIMAEKNAEEAIRQEKLAAQRAEALREQLVRLEQVLQECSAKKK